MKKTLTGPDGTPLPYQLDVDDKYECIDEVLLDGKTMRDVTDSQLIYLYRTIRTQLELQVVGGELVRRLTQVEEKDETKI